MTGASPATRCTPPTSTHWQPGVAGEAGQPPPLPDRRHAVRRRRGARRGVSHPARGASVAPNIAAAPITTEHLAAHDAGEADEVEFGPAPPVFPAGAEMAVIQGDPSLAGEAHRPPAVPRTATCCPPTGIPPTSSSPSSPARFYVGLGDAFDEGELLHPRPRRLRPRPGQRQPLRHRSWRDRSPGPCCWAVRAELRQSRRRSAQPGRLSARKPSSPGSPQPVRAPEAKLPGCAPGPHRVP